MPRALVHDDRVLGQFRVLLQRVLDLLRHAFRAEFDPIVGEAAGISRRDEDMEVRVCVECTESFDEVVEMMW